MVLNSPTSRVKGQRGQGERETDRQETHAIGHLSLFVICHFREIADFAESLPSGRIPRPLCPFAPCFAPRPSTSSPLIALANDRGAPLAQGGKLGIPAHL